MLLRGKWLENVDRTHLVLASGKLILQKVPSDEVGQVRVQLTLCTCWLTWKTKFFLHCLSVFVEFILYVVIRLGCSVNHRTSFWDLVDTLSRMVGMTLKPD